MSSCILRTAAAAALLAVSVMGQGLCSGSLLSNGGFESGLSGWTAVTGSVSLRSYGGSGNLSLAAGVHIGGGIQYIRDLSGNAVLEQSIDLVPFAALVASGAELDLSAYLGGVSVDSDSAQIEVEFSQGGSLLGNGVLGPVLVSQRNRETILLKRRKFIAIPSGSDTALVRVRMNYFGGGASGSVDTICALVVPSQGPAALPTNQQLLVNGDFESGWSATSPLTPNEIGGWEAETASSTVVTYGGSAAQSIDVGAALSGGAGYWKDVGGNAALVQLLDVSGNTAAISAGSLELQVTADLGGLSTDPDDAALEIEFLDAGGSIVGTDTLEAVGVDMRNRESVLLRRKKTMAIPGSCEAIQVRLQASYFGGGANSSADNLDVRLVPAVAPTPQPLSTELVVNGDFEGGWTVGSPLILQDPSGWVGDGGVTIRETYGSASLPSAAVATAIGGGSNLLRDSSGNGQLIQSFDLRGNASDIQAGLLSVELMADLGGVSTDSDSAQVDVEFFDASGISLGGGSTQETTMIQRNRESVLMRRRATIPVPTTAESMIVRCDMNYAGGGAQSLMDNVSAQLVMTSTPAAVPLNTDFVSNGGFEQGWDCTVGGGCGTVCQSPLQLSNPAGWTGDTTVVVVSAYGGSFTPTTSFATTAGAGCSVLSDLGGGGGLRQRIDVSGNAGQIDAQALLLQVDALLGGFAGDADSSEIEAEFRTASGALIAVFPAAITGPVTAADRGNLTTLLPRIGEFPVPPLTRFIDIIVRMNHAGGSARSLVDNVSAQLINCTGIGQTNSLEARLDVNSIGGLACGGPFAVSIPAGGTLVLDWSGSPSSPLILAVGQSTPVGLSLGGGVGILGLDPLGPIDIVFDGTLSTFPEILFRTDLNGRALQSFSVPFSGANVTIQGAVVQPLGAPVPIVLTAAFDLSFL